MYLILSFSFHSVQTEPPHWATAPSLRAHLMTCLPLLAILRWFLTFPVSLSQKWTFPKASPKLRGSGVCIPVNGQKLPCLWQLDIYNLCSVSDLLHPQSLSTVQLLSSCFYIYAGDFFFSEQHLTLGNWTAFFNHFFSFINSSPQ